MGKAGLNRGKRRELLGVEGIATKRHEKARKGEVGGEEIFWWRRFFHLTSVLSPSGEEERGRWRWWER
jgi:hypothetical protein